MYDRDERPHFVLLSNATWWEILNVRVGNFLEEKKLCRDPISKREWESIKWDLMPEGLWKYAKNREKQLYAWRLTA